MRYHDVNHDPPKPLSYALRLLTRRTFRQVPRHLPERRAACTSELGDGDVYERHRLAVLEQPIQPVFLCQDVRAYPQVEGELSMACDEPNLTSSEIVKQCLAIVKRRRKGKIDTGEAKVLFYNIVPSSEEGVRALREYICMCAEVDREDALAVAKGRQVADRLRASDIAAGIQLTWTSGQAGEPDESNGHSDDEEQISNLPSLRRDFIGWGN
ncbi:hypothetical protein M422DRAFT_251185 [Sphaerobolus stellatus SS14]|uniref:Uncharacterized protein n=1 Tax=Sphaerobolus stellatus (strain SS14) TaxID=990650 RepID=A0A0C9VEK1_SPHS4|nr:hypothetical protein M422DRAFT_251185 [Sphaerobolus stellatus SS14]